MFTIKAGVVAFTLIAGLHSTALAGSSFDQIGLGQASANALNLCIFVTGPKDLDGSKSTSLWSGGNAGLSAGAHTGFKDGGTLTGILYKDPGATVQPDVGPAGSKWKVLGGVVTQSLAAAAFDVKQASALALMLTPNTTVDNVGKTAVTLTNAAGVSNGLGGKNTVVQIKNDVDINKSTESLTIQGGANDWFIIQCLKKVHVHDGGKIKLSGGIPASHVLFVLAKSGDKFEFQDNDSSVAGTYLATFPGQKIKTDKGVTILGGVIGDHLDLNGGAKITCALYQQVPVPGTSALLGLGGLLAARRRRAA